MLKDLLFNDVSWFTTLTFKTIQVENGLTKDYRRQQLQLNAYYSYDPVTKSLVFVAVNEMEQ